MRRNLLALATCMALSAPEPALAQGAAPPIAQPPWLLDSIEFHGDVPYADGDNPRQTLDLLVPRLQSDERLPVVVLIHGGAWLAGHKRDALRPAQPLIESGQYAVASIGYRLSGEAQWPAQIHDCKAAIRWLRAHADAHRLDADRIGVWGASAGGHLAAVLGTSGDVATLEGDLGPHRDVSSRVACVVDYFGPTDFLQMNRTAIPGARLDHDSPHAPEALLVGGPIQEHRERVATANPITYVTPDDPPFLLVHGTQDELVPVNQSELLNAALRQAGVSSTLLTVDGGGHGMGFPMAVHEAARQFLDHHLRGIAAEQHDETFPASF